ncbi:DUF202 domain-containing protein [Fulvivirga lutea]|uniref:DUF202 domain-containing protein n=1 Tax=Fulvivirga lutea TaxID=2810512 RepID=A0A974WDF0_9BACT|nr:DUF202 domain-containing protein [Fulvivirga lutea]QSE95984.1 DUF202 domain-containing protein [Fulvivirga lutea]
MRKFKRFTSNYSIKEKIILRDFLALERTTLANERTFFAYIRAGIYLSLAGIAILKLKNFESITWLGTVLFGISAFFFVFGIVRYQLLQKKLNKFYDLLDEEKMLKELKKNKLKESED